MGNIFDLDCLDERLKDCIFIIACDSENTLCGENGIREKKV